MVQLSVIISGVFFGAVASIIARRKGRQELLWFVLGFIFHVFGLIVLLLPSVSRPGTTKQCPECAEVVKAEASRCRYCGKAFDMVSEAEVV